MYQLEHIKKGWGELMSTEITIATNKEYFDEYFKICDMLQKRYDLLRDIESPADKSIPEGGIDALKKDVEEMKVSITEKEDSFWAAVKNPIDVKGKFVMEDFASGYGLEPFEKRTLLFLLYRQFVGGLDDSFYKQQLTKMLDINDSVVDRICNLRYLDRDGRLSKEGLICKEMVRQSIIAISLSTKAVSLFSKMLRGEKVEFTQEKKSDLSACEEIGYVKEPEYAIDNVVVKDDIKEKIRLFIETSGGSTVSTPEAPKTSRPAKGAIFLFYGPPGTGKSMLAEAVASMLGKKLLVVEYPKIMSRWVGETDKKILQAFKSAKENDFVLLMDEADSLLYDRNYAGQEHDIRFVNDMLQQLDRFEGIAILTTNMDNLLDPAVERRINLRIKLDEPDEEMRSKIWKAHIPPHIKIAEDVDFALLGRRYEFSGGYIKNAVHAAIRKITLDKSDTLNMDGLLFGANIEKDGMFNKEKRNKIGFLAMQ